MLFHVERVCLMGEQIYRQKLPVVHAEQFIWEKRPWPERTFLHTPRLRCAYVMTEELGRQRVESGDWIVVDSSGAVSVMKPTAFLHGYEPE